MNAHTDDVPGRPRVSIVVLNYNGHRHLPLWESFFTEKFADKEIVFVDNGSTDGSDEEFRRLAAKNPGTKVRIHKIPENVGYSQGCIEGARQARGEILVLLNNDIEISPHFVEPLVTELTADSRLQLVQANLYSLYKRNRPDEVWNRLDVFGYAHLQQPLGDSLTEVFYVEGAAFAFRRELLLDVGYLYPPEYFMLFEDVDLSWRTRLRGFRCAVVRGAIAWHARGGTEEGGVTKLNPRLLQCATRNRLATLFTNYGSLRMIIFVPLSASLSLGRALLLWHRRERTYARSVFQGVVSFLRDLGFLRERRRHVQLSRRVSDREALSLLMGPTEALHELVGLWARASEERFRLPVTPPKPG